MKELEKFIEFLVHHRNDDRIKIYRKMKYGYKYFYIDYLSESDSSVYYRPSLSIVIDNRNKCIEVSSNNEESIIIEDNNLIDYWSSKLDKMLSDEVDGKIKSIIEKTLISSDNKDLHREYLMKKIIEDESI